MNEQECKRCLLDINITVYQSSKIFRADAVRQKSARRRAEAKKILEKEQAETLACQEKADHRLKERLGNE